MTKKQAELVTEEKSEQEEIAEMGMRFLDESTIEVTLTEPINFGGEDVRQFVLRKPKGLDLAGINMTDILNHNVTTLSQVIPKISEPMILSKHISNMDMLDIQILGQGVHAFFISPADRKLYAKMGA